MPQFNLTEMSFLDRDLRDESMEDGVNSHEVSTERIL